MSATSSLADILQPAFDSRENLVEFVDLLLRLCAENELHLKMQPDASLLRSSKQGLSEHVFKNPFSKSRFRAVLARIAALCNQGTQGLSPYRGMASVRITSDRLKSIRVSFANTPDEQFLEIEPIHLQDRASLPVGLNRSGL